MARLELRVDLNGREIRFRSGCNRGPREDWQQETAGAIVRRLLVVSMACVIVWQLACDELPEGEETRRVLVQLSGRQMKRSQPFTAHDSLQTPISVETQAPQDGTAAPAGAALYLAD